MSSSPQQQHKRSCSFRSSGCHQSPCRHPVDSTQASVANAPSTGKRFSLTDTLSKSSSTQPPLPQLSPTSRQRRRTSVTTTTAQVATAASGATGESASPGFERRLEDSLRDLRIMQARMSRNSVGGGGGGGNGGPGACIGGSRQVGSTQGQHQASANPLPLSPLEAPTPDRDGSPTAPPVTRQRAMSLATAALTGMELTGHRSLSSLVGRGGEATAAVSMTTSEAASSALKLTMGCGSEGCSAGSISGEYRRERRRASMQDAIDASKINADLYSKVYNQTNAIQSIQEENLGQLNFSLGYREETGILTVRIIQAIDLQPKDSSTGSANPYCRVALLPNRKTQSTTKVHKKTLRPEFEEAFIFELAQQDIHWSVLEITVFDYDPCSLDDCLGQVRLPLTDVLDTDSAPAGAEVQTTLWKGLASLEKDPDPEHKIGDLMFSLSFLSAAKRLGVSIIKARNLRDIHKDKPMSDTSVRVTLSTHGGRKQKRKKTSSCKTPANPVWEEALVFNGVAEDDLRSGSLEISVCHEGVLSSTEMGRVYLGPDTTGQEYQHWWNMLKSKSAPARWHRLMTPATTGASK